MSDEKHPDEDQPDKEEREEAQDDLNFQEIYRAVNLDFIEDDFDGNGTPLIGEMHGNLLATIERFVDEVMESRDLAFTSDGAKLTPLRFARYFPLMPALMRQNRPPWSHSLKVERFFKTAEMLEPLTLRYPQSKAGSMTEGEVFNAFIASLRASCRSTAFRRQLRQQDMRTKRRLEKLRRYIENLFRLYSRILVIRIDFLYKGAGDAITLERVLKDFATLVNNGRHNKIFEHQIGSIRRLEYGVKDHYHIHAVFIFDGSKVWKDAFIAEMIGAYWVKITEGRGHFHNCNRAKNKYRRLGIGMISHDDAAMRANLMLALAYLCKKDQLLWVEPGQRVRAIECGRLGSRQRSGRGRPRQSGPHGGDGQ